MAQKISIFRLSTLQLNFRDITFVTDVSVPTIETIKLVFKSVQTMTEEDETGMGMTCLTTNYKKRINSR